MRRVLDGGVGICNGGIEERSIDILTLDARDDGRDVGGDVGEVGVDKVLADIVVVLAKLLLSRKGLNSTLRMKYIRVTVREKSMSFPAREEWHLVVYLSQSCLRGRVDDHGNTVEAETFLASMFAFV